MNTGDSHREEKIVSVLCEMYSQKNLRTLHLPFIFLVFLFLLSFVFPFFSFLFLLSFVFPFFSFYFSFLISCFSKTLLFILQNIIIIGRSRFLRQNRTNFLIQSSNLFSQTINGHRIFCPVAGSLIRPRLITDSHNRYDRSSRIRLRLCLSASSGNSYQGAAGLIIGTAIIVYGRERHDPEFQDLAEPVQGHHAVGRALPQYEHQVHYPPPLVMALTQELNHGRWNPRPTTRFESKKRPSCYKKRSKPSVRFVPVWLLNSANSVRTVSMPFATPRTTSAGSVASPATLLLTVTVPYQNGTLTLRHRSPRLNGLSAIVSHGNRG